MNQKSKQKPLCVAYTMSRFPKLTETFVLYEIIELRNLGLDVQIFPLIHEKEPNEHPEVQRLMPHVHFASFISLPIIWANLHSLFSAPKRYLRTLWGALSGNWGARKYFIRALVIFPKMVYFSRQIQDLGIQHLHAHFASHPALGAWIVHQMTGIPYSFTAHAHDIYRVQKMLDRKIEAAEFAVVISDFNRRFLNEHVGEWVDEKLQTVRCGIFPEVFTAGPERASNSTCRILCVAALKDMKGHRFLIQACADLRDKALDFHCDLVGNGPLREDIQAQIQSLDLSEYFTIHGAMPRPEVARLTQEADVAVLACVRGARGEMDGIPVALMEAMASELPVVSTRISGLPELIEPDVTGYLAEPGDSNGLTIALEKLIGDPALRQRMGAAGREKVKREFDLRTNTKHLADLFQQSVSSNF